MRPLKPGYNSEAVQKELVDRVCSYFGRVFDNAEREKAEQLRGCRDQKKKEEILGHAPDGRRYPSLSETAKEFGFNIMKVRKLLITGGFYSTEESRAIQKLYANGLTMNQIAEQKNLGSSVVASYLPYSRVIYNLDEKSVNADRIDRFNERHGRGKYKPRKSPEQLMVFKSAGIESSKTAGSNNGDNNGDNIDSLIILSGQWLKDAGFCPGDRFALTVNRNSITITREVSESLTCGCTGQAMTEDYR